MSSALLSATGNPLPALLKELPQGLGELAGKAEHEVQILYTAIDRKNDGTPVFTTHSWQLDDRFYFYPASTVKFPAALAALEKKNALARTNPELDGNSVMLTDQSETWQTAVTEDPSATNGLPSLNHYIRKIFLVSDNDAFNRLFEFVGYEEMNGSLRSKGMTGCSIIHRLALKREKHHGRYANPIRFLRGNEVLCQLPARVGSSSEEHGQIVRRGVGYFSGGQLIPDPMDFSQSNFYPLTAQQECLKRLVFPAAYGPTERFELTPEDRQLVLDAMGRFPGESTSPVYPRERYPDSYTKMLGFGAGTDPIPSHVRVFSKSGMAYGYLIDNIYFVDFDRDIEFFLAAVIHVNENRIFNDNLYQYDEKGLPFLKELGLAVYRFEKQRDRQHRPDLTDLPFAPATPTSASPD